MREKVLFVDLENVQKVDLGSVPHDTRVMVFYGIMQKKLPEELVVRAQPLGARLQWIKISGQGPNALDFHIAYYLGQELTRTPAAACVILSRDTGFDPLIRHLNAGGHTCSRVESLREAFPETERRQDPEPYARLVSLLKKERNRPARRRGLAGKVRSWFPKLTDEVRSALIQRLFKESRVRESQGSLTYTL
jgi:hypothetical protein